MTIPGGAPRARGPSAGVLRPHRRAARVTVAIAVLALLALSAPLHRQVADLLLSAQPMIVQHPIAGAALFVALAALSAVLMFFSSVVLVPIGIVAWGPFPCFLMLWGGWFLGGVLTYATGRFLGRPVVHRFVSREKIAQYESGMPRGAWFTSAFLMQLAVPSDIAGYLFGLVQYRPGPFLAALALAELPYALGAVYVGDAFVERQYGVLIAAAVLAGGVATWIWWRARPRTPAGPPVARDQDAGRRSHD